MPVTHIKSLCSITDSNTQVAKGFVTHRGSWYKMATNLSVFFWPVCANK